MTRTRIGTTSGWTIALLAAVLLIASPQAWARTKRALPEKAAAAVREIFPQAAITGIGREREHGVMFYEVNLRQTGMRIEVEVTAEGVIGEIESRIGVKDLPADVKAKVKKAISGGRIRSIERHEVRGAVRDGKMVPLPLAKVVYEVRFYLKGRRRIYRTRSSEVPVLPAKVAEAIHAAFPKAIVMESEIETEYGAKLIEVELEQGDDEFEVLVTADGVIVSVAVEIDVKDLPKPVAGAARKIAEGGNIEEAERVQLRATKKGDIFVKLKTPTTAYEVEIVKDDMEREILFAPDGKVLKQSGWQADDEDDDDEDDDDDDDDD